MNFVTAIRKATGKEFWGALSPSGKILDLHSLAPSLLSFIENNGSAKFDEIRRRLPEANINLSEVDLRACLPRPPSMRDAYAFRQHVEAARRNRGVPMIAEFDNFPIFYYTNHQAVIGPGPCEVQAQHLEQLDFELESAIVIGKRGKNISASEADAYIFGYTIMNDFSARKLQMEEMKMSLGPAKGKDFATALGPYLVTSDDLLAYRKPSPQGDRYSLEMTCDVNGAAISKGNMADMTWTFAQIIERVSYGTYVYPGDVIGSGTVGTGCFLELNGSGVTKQWLKAGDRVSLKITKLGELENTIQLVPESRA